MPAKNTKVKEHLHYHKDGTLWAKGQTIDGAMTGYWEWFRKDGTKLRSGCFGNGQQIGEWTTYDKPSEAYKITTMKTNKRSDRRFVS